jgi:glycerol-3-phosphate acyltransferase PlsY
MRVAVALCVAYLLGSVLPADLFARARGVDIRAVGTRNPGATNALQVLGTLPGLITLVYDASVGLVSMYVAWLLGLSSGWIYLSGVMAIVGHCYPVFSRFRGGQGMAAATTMLLFGMGVALANGWLSAADMALLGILGLVVFVLTRSATDVGVFVAPLLAIELLLAGPEWQFTLFMTGLTTFIWLTQLRIAQRQHLFRLTDSARAHVSRLRLLMR